MRLKENGLLTKHSKYLAQAITSIEANTVLRWNRLSAKSKKFVRRGVKDFIRVERRKRLAFLKMLKMAKHALLRENRWV